MIAVGIFFTDASLLSFGKVDLGLIALARFLQHGKSILRHLILGEKHECLLLPFCFMCSLCWRVALAFASPAFASGQFTGFRLAWN